MTHVSCFCQVVSFLSTKDIPGTIAELKQAVADNSLANDFNTIGLTLISSDAIQAVRPAHAIVLHPHPSRCVGTWVQCLALRVASPVALLVSLSEAVRPVRTPVRHLPP